jgi:hypothetical protein
MTKHALSQGLMLDDPCGGTGLLTVTVGKYSLCARCLCSKGQLQMSAVIPLITEVRAVTTEQLQELWPAGIPEVIPREEVVRGSHGTARKTRKQRAAERLARGLTTPETPSQT